MGNNSFIDARSNVKKSFVLAIIVGVFSLIGMNYYKNGYKTGLIFSIIFKSEKGIDFTSPFVDMLWWLNLLSLVSGIILVAALIFCRFKWPSKYIVAIPAGVKLICSVLIVVIFSTRNYPMIKDAVENEIYEIKDAFYVLSVLYILAYLLILVSVFLPETASRIVGYAGVVSLGAVFALSFFLASPYSIPYTLVATESGYSYRSLSVMVSDIVGALAIVFMSLGLNVYHRCLKEDEELEDED